MLFRARLSLCLCSHYDAGPLAGLHLQDGLHHLRRPVHRGLPGPAAVAAEALRLVAGQVTVVQSLVRGLKTNVT